MRYAVPLAALLLAVAGCGGQDPAPTGSASPPGSAASASSSPSGSTTSPSAQAVGSAASPAPAPVAKRPLAWRAVDAAIETAVTTNGEWTLTVAADGRSAQLAGPALALELGLPGRTVSDAFLTETHALVVRQDPQETRPADAVVVELETGRQTRLDARSEIPTTTGGTWALGPDRVVHATAPGRDYCLASVDLASGASTRGWCAPPRQGFNNARVTAAGTTVMSFDDARPSCRTVAEVRGSTLAPLPGVPRCQAWEAVLLAGGAVWSVVEREDAVEAARLYARSGHGWFDLGPGTSGTLVECGGAAYFARDSDAGRRPAQLLRWDGRELAVVYESPPGPAFLDTPRCGGDTLTVSAFAEGGDEQVSARVG